jgi:hypothetical protein
LLAQRDLARVEMIQEEADIVSRLVILLGTTPGERVMRSLYGCDLSDLLFESLDTRMKTRMADRVESATRGQPINSEDGFLAPNLVGWPARSDPEPSFTNGCYQVTR